MCVFVNLCGTCVDGLFGIINIPEGWTGIRRMDFIKNAVLFLIRNLTNTHHLTSQQPCFTIIYSFKKSKYSNRLINGAGLDVRSCMGIFSFELQEVC